MKLWQKEFAVNRDIEKFTIDDDRTTDLHLATYDILGSLAHAHMLKNSGLVSELEWEKINEGLKDLYKDWENGTFSIEDGVEDIHSEVEKRLIEKAGEAGKKIHTGRSRNDQVLVDLRLYFRDQLLVLADHAGSLASLLIELSTKNQNIFMPGYTHFQAAMPSSFGLWFGAYGESVTEDIEWLQAMFGILNRNPLGSAAGYGSSFPLNRKITTDLLGFSSLNINSIAAQMGRGKTERMLSQGMAQLADTLGRLSGEICLYMGQDFGFFNFPDELTTGSSIMPHKKNPDVFELIRGKCNQVKSLVTELQLMTSNLPSGYHRDYQLMKARMIGSISVLSQCLTMMKFMLENIRVNPSLRELEKYKYVFSVELINEYVRKGIPFRDAYTTVSQLISEGKFKIPDSPAYTHEGSTGNLMNDQILQRLVKALNFFEEISAYVNSKFNFLLGRK